jgi:hypothetical protein
MANVKKIGRPIEYSEEIGRKSIKYLEMCNDQHTEFHRTRSDGSNSFERIVNVKIPTIEGLALSIDISRDTVYDWKSKYPEFSYIIDKLMAIQADRLLNNGLSGTYNPTIAKVLLTKHGYREGVDNTTNGKDLPTPLLTALISEKDSFE